MPPARGHGRYPYSPIHRRPAYDWPEGKRLAVYIGLNLEWFAFGEGLGAEGPGATGAGAWAEARTWVAGSTKSASNPVSR